VCGGVKHQKGSIGWGKNNGEHKPLPEKCLKAILEEKTEKNREQGTYCSKTPSGFHLSVMFEQGKEKSWKKEGGWGTKNGANVERT